MLNVGDQVRYHTYQYGWRFGQIIGLHRDDQGANPSGLDMATVRFLPYAARYGRPDPGGDEALAVFLLEKCG